MKIFLTTFAVLSALCLSASAATILSGPGISGTYVGDFGTGVTIGASVGTGNSSTITIDQLDDGWISHDGGGTKGLAWSVSSEQAVRSGGDGSRPNGLAILFSSQDYSGQATLSFDYNFGSDTTNGEPGFYIWGIDTDTFTSEDLRQGDLSENDASNVAGATSLITDFTDNNGTSGSFSQSVSLDANTYEAYLFAFYGESGNDTYVDNVKVTVIPEPSAMALLPIGLAFLLLRRRRF